jgi:hypothetical protein
LVLVIAAAGPAMAGNATEAKWRHACWRDAFSLCTLHALAAERAAVRDCLLRNMSRLSRGCREVIDEARAERQKGVEPPADPAVSAAPIAQ